MNCTEFVMKKCQNKNTILEFVFNFFLPIFRRLSQSNLDGVYVNPDDETLYEKVTYLDANVFMSDFEKTLFPHSLGESLGFDETEISRAKSIPGKIFCNMIDESDPDSFIPCEVSIVIV